MKSLRAAVLTARALLAKGHLGQSLLEGLREAHPNLTAKSCSQVLSRVRGEVGVLGQAAHDPNLYPNCKVASAEKERHPAPHALIATVMTPMCSSCSCNRQGNCSLMGGRLVASTTDLPEGSVQRTANILVEDGSLTKQEASAVVRAASLSSSQKVAALHLKRRFKLENQKSRTSAHAASRRASAILEGDTSSFDQMTRPHDRTRDGRIANADDPGVDGLFTERAGDQRLAARARRAASVLNSRSMQVEVPGDPRRPLSKVEIASENHITMDLSPLGSQKGRKAGLGVDHENPDTRNLFEHSRGDNQVARRAAGVADILSGSHFDVQLPGEAPKPARVKLASESTFDVPEFETLGRVAGEAADEHLEQVQGAVEGLIRKASRALGEGRMTASRADQVLTNLDQLVDQGAVLSKAAHRIIAQLRPLCGGLEL